MARYFQAPVLQPVDYGYQMPFQQIYGAMQMEQQKFNEGEKAVLDLYSFEKLNALEQDYAKRNELVQERYNNTDAIMYDENGNQRDMRYVMPSVKKEARRRAKQEQSGGEWYQIDTNFKLAEKYKEQLQKMHEKGDITKERRDFLEYHSLYELYTGIGDGSTGSYNQFRGMTAAKELDDMQVAYDYAKDVATQKLQAAGLMDAQGHIIATDANLEAALKNQFASVLNGDYIQTGTVEFRTFELLKRLTNEALKNNTELHSDIRQEAYMKGYRTDAQAKEFLDKKIDYLASNAALKYAEAKFSPQLIADWRRQEAARHASAMAVARYQKQEPVSIFGYNSTDSKITVNAKTSFTKYAASTQAKAAAENDLKLLEEQLAKDPNNDVIKAQIQNKKKEIMGYEKDLYQQNSFLNPMYDKLGKKDGGQFILGKTAEQAVKILTGWTGSGSMYGPNKNIVSDAEAYLRSKYVDEDGNFDGTLLAHAVKDGTAFKDQGFIDAVTKSASKQSTSAQWNVAGRTPKKIELSEAFKNGTYTGEDFNTLLTEEIPDTEYATTIQGWNTTDSASKNYVANVNENVSQLIVTNAQAFQTMDGKTFPGVNAWLESLGIKNYSNIKITTTPGKSVHPVDGSPVTNVSISYKDSKDKEVKLSPIQLSIHGETANSVNAGMIEAGYQLIDGATRLESKDKANSQIAEGTLMIGMHTLTGTGMEKLASLNNEDVVPIRKPGSDNVQFYVKKVNGGYVLGYPNFDENGNATPPSWSNSEAFYKDSRPQHQKTSGNPNFLFENENAIYEAIGWEKYLLETNQYKTDGKTRPISE